MRDMRMVIMKMMPYWLLISCWVWLLLLGMIGVIAVAFSGR